jgi:hypothetical protein
VTTTFPLSIPSQFDKFHAENPHVYTILVKEARKWVRQFGRQKLGIAMLFERARWVLAFATNDPDYKLNNNYRAYYARLIMHQEDDLDALFDIRDSEADEWLANLIDRENNGQGGLW